MTILYRPVLIESVEQAEALPEGTVVIEVDAKTGTHNWAFTSEAWSPDDLNVFPTEYHIALVPVEAEEEWAAEFDSGEMYMNLDQDSARNADGGAAMSRLVTPWEEA